MSVAAINGVLVANIAAVDGVLAADIAAVDGVPFSGGGGLPPVGSILSMDFDGPDGGTTFTDDSPYARTFTGNGGVDLDTAQFVNGGSSLLLNSSGKYITASAGAELSFSGDFTWQADLRMPSGSTGGFFLAGDGNSAFLAIEGDLSTNSGILRIGRANIAYDLTSSASMGVDVWYRVRAQRISGTLKLYIDGVEVASASNSTTYTFSTNIKVGRYDASFHFTGWIDNLRMD